MSILADKNTRVLIQGITGTQASFHVKRSIENGTNVVAGTSPGHEGEKHAAVGRQCLEVGGGTLEIADDVGVALVGAALVQEVGLPLCRGAHEACGS